MPRLTRTSAALPLGLLLAATLTTAALAALPAPSAEAKANAAEAAAKAAWNDKVSGYQLCKSQDALAAAYRTRMQQSGKTTGPAVDTPPCADPGPFAYAPPTPATPPLEAAGAHSPAANAAQPPSSKSTQAELRDGKTKP